MLNVKRVDVAVLSHTVYERIIAKIRRKTLIPRVQGHSRSLEPTRSDRLPMTSY